MSEAEERTSIIDLEGTFRTTDIEMPEIEGAPQQAEKKAEKKPEPKVPEKPREKPVRKANKEGRSGIAELKILHKNRMQEIIKKHNEERQMLRKEIKEQAKKSRDDLGKGLRQTERTYRVQLDELRRDYESRTVKLQNELENFLAGKMTEMKEHSEKVVLDDSQDRMEKLQEWLHGEFVSELQNKTNELEQTKASADVQVQGLVKEVDQKNQQIVFLQGKIKEISQHLKRHIREEYLQELGLEDDLDREEKVKKKKKSHKKGLFARLTGN
ncbi:MAG TPA: hypothetical protein VLA68_02380 [Nitrososphaera sp.]|nr:hypothetical protein [Nitrososphaera sp.]